MKKFKILVFLTLTIAFLGCEKDFLDRPDLDSINSSSFWKTTKDLELYVNQFYSSLSVLPTGTFSAGVFWSDQNSDNMITETVNSRLAGLTGVASGGGSWGFSRIRNVNIMLENYSSVEDDFDNYKHFVGEALFFRAYYHFNLLRSFGDIPYLDKVLSPDSPELFNAREPRDVVANKIIADLDEAISYMKSGPIDNGNRLNKEVAMLFKARVALYEGTWEKYHAGTVFGATGLDGAAFINIAANTASDIISSGIYVVSNTGKPESDYFNLFNRTDLGNNKEVLFWRKYDLDLGITHNIQRFLSDSGGGRGFTKALVDNYLCTDGLPIEASTLYQGDDDLLAVSTNRDPRLSQTIWIPGQIYEMQGGTVTEFFELPALDGTGEQVCPTGYQIRKGSTPDFNQKANQDVGTTTTPIFRYAEALLIFAEAKAELGTFTQNDADISINKLRQRVGMPNLQVNNITSDPNWLFPTLSPIINEVRRERHVEFAAEGFRQNDLLRWAAMDEVIIGKRSLGAKFKQEDFPNLVVGTDVFLDADGYIDPHQGQLPNGYEFRVDTDYLLPIPLEQLTLNPNLTQNPGWPTN